MVSFVMTWCVQISGKALRVSAPAPSPTSLALALASVPILALAFLLADRLLLLTLDDRLKPGPQILPVKLVDLPDKLLLFALVQVVESPRSRLFFSV